MCMLNLCFRISSFCFFESNLEIISKLKLRIRGYVVKMIFVENVSRRL